VRTIVLAAAVAVGASLLAGCSGGTAKVTPPAQLSIRGTQLFGFTCSAGGDPTPVTVAPSSVTEVRLCPPSTPTAPHRTVTVDQGDPMFARLVNALSAPDRPATSAVCPAYADVPQDVIGRTNSGLLLRIHVPVDGCGHYLAAALSALTALRPAG
jgi:hypothetical protein